jgi:ABC-type transporter Mla maintaining outer membrane lipid asymmetry ATPase subunit MlaF
VGIGVPPSMPDAIVVADLAKHFDTIDAVAGISFNVQRGELFGFPSPNGAGKSATINLFTGPARPDRGSIRLGGGVEAILELRSLKISSDLPAYLAFHFEQEHKRNCPEPPIPLAALEAA